MLEPLHSKTASIMLPISSPALKSCNLSRSMIASTRSLKSISRLLFPGGWCPNPQHGTQGLSSSKLHLPIQLRPQTHMSCIPPLAHALAWNLSLFHYTPWFLTPPNLSVCNLPVCLGTYYWSLEIQLKCYFLQEDFPDNLQPRTPYSVNTFFSSLL